MEGRCIVAATVIKPITDVDMLLSFLDLIHVVIAKLSKCTFAGA